MEPCLWNELMSSRTTGKSTSVHVGYLPFVLFWHFRDWFSCVSAIKGCFVEEAFVSGPVLVIPLADLWWICLLVCECAFHVVWWIFLLPFCKMRSSDSVPAHSSLGCILGVWKDFNYDHMAKYIYIDFKNTVWPQYSLVCREKKRKKLVEMKEFWNSKLVPFAYAGRRSWLDKTSLDNSDCEQISPFRRKLHSSPHPQVLKM